MKAKSSTKRKRQHRDAKGRFCKAPVKKKAARLRDKRGRFRAKPKRDARGRFVGAKEKEVFDFFDDKKKQAEAQAKKIIEQAQREADEIKRLAQAEFTDAETAARMVADAFRNIETSRSEQIKALFKLHKDQMLTYPESFPTVRDWIQEFMGDAFDEIQTSEIYSTLFGSPPDDIGVAA